MFQNKKNIIHDFKKNLSTWIFLISSIYCQDYLWPVKAEKALTAVFGEERPGRYHTGIDIRTFGEIGYPLQAIDDGYVSRIQTSSKKYGKTLYLTLHDGNTVVYAHLDHFTPEIDNLVSALHEYYGKYTIDHYFKKPDHIFKKGDIIGYSGDTGGVSGPHLHFEIRDENQQPINPFITGLSIKDAISPIINSVALIPFNRNSYVNGISEETIFKVKKINDSEFILMDTININGSVGIALNTHDRITNQEFNFGIHAIELYQDDQLIYSMKYDNMKWADSNKLYTEKNYSLARKGEGKFYHLFTRHGNQNLSFINDDSKDQLISKENEFSRIMIKVFDYSKNETILKFILFQGVMPNTDDFTINCNIDCLIKFDSKDNIKPLFHLHNRYDENYRKKLNHEILENNLFKISEIHYPIDMIELSIINDNGVKSKPFFFIPNKELINLNGKISLKHYDHGIFIIFDEETPSEKNAFLTFEINNESYRHTIERRTPFQYSTRIFSPIELENVSKINMHLKESKFDEIFSMNLSGKTIIPESDFNFSLLENRIIIKGEKNTFHDTTFIWAELMDVPKPKSGILISNAYKIQPNLIPYEKEIQLEIALEKNHFPEYASIYYYSNNKNTWNYMPSTFNEDSTYLITKILSGETFAIINENTPPQFSSLLPDINGTYFSSDIKHISFFITDEFSGIDAEKDISMKLDGKHVIFEYNSYQKKVRYPLKNRLNVGEHELYIEAKDRVGNISIKKGIFNIK